jgi:hypothetical protein
MQSSTKRVSGLCLAALLALTGRGFAESGILQYVTAEPHYQQVAYIETDGNSYLNTGVDSSADLEVQTRIKPLAFVQTYRPVFRAYKGEPDNTFRLIQSTSASAGWYINPNTAAGTGSTGVPTSQVPYGAWTSFVLMQWKYAYGTTTNNITTKTQGIAYSGPMQIAGVNMKCRYAYFRMLKSGVLVFNGIPVIAPSGQGALYDTISKRLIENLGAGTITYGLTED